MNRPVEWPDKAAYTPTTIGGMAPWDKAEYERAMKEAALQRLAIAVEALKRFTSHYDCDDCWYSCATICCDERRKSDECDCGAARAIETLAAIGPLPDLSKEPT